MNVKPAWDANYTGKGILVAVVDDGVKIDHPDLSPNMVSYDDDDNNNNNNNDNNNNNNNDINYHSVLLHYHNFLRLRGLSLGPRL